MNSATIHDDQDENAEDDDQCYHAPLFLNGIHDRDGRLQLALDVSRVVQQVEVAIHNDYFFFVPPQEEDTPLQVEQPSRLARDFFVRLSRLHGLQVIRFMPCNLGYDLPVSLVTTVLSSSSTTKLQQLVICGMVLTGSPQEFQAWLQALARHKSLQVLRLIRCTFRQFDNVNQNGVENDLLVEELCRILATEIPTFQEVELCPLTLTYVADMGEVSLSPRAMQCLYESPQSLTVRLDNVELTANDHILPLFRALEERSQLKAVSLDGTCQIDTVQALQGIAKMLRQNQTLQDFSMSLPTPAPPIIATTTSDNDDDDNDNDESSTRLPTTNEATATTNAAPKHSELDEAFLAIAHALEHNSTLNYLRLTAAEPKGWSKITAVSSNNNKTNLPLLHRTTIETAFCSMLKHNYTLENLSLLDWTTGDLQRQIVMYFFLNRMGRRRIMDENTATRQDWCQVIVKATADLTCLYYILSMNPKILDEIVFDDG